ncbi:CHAT domain-containing protein [Paractinoplanes deccanensis]|nr:CHAT domain-containing protein [Actinoplanes deccanensis]
MSLALVLAEAGRPTRALSEIDAAAPHLSGLDAARLHMQRALILDRLGHLDVAMAGYTAAVRELEAAGDRLWLARALTNRGVLHVYRASTGPARADLLAARDLYDELGQRLAVAQVEHNLGFAAARAGDLLAAIHWYDRADEYLRVHGRAPLALIGRCELFLHARLLPEALAAAKEAAAVARGGRMMLYEAQARLMHARVALAAGDLAAARAEAEAARRSFRRQRLPAWAALARYVAIRSGAGGLRAARAVAADLAAAGWPAPALDARLHAAGLAAGRPGAAAELPEVLVATRRGPAEQRARAWHAAALLRDAEGDTAGARRALRAGIRVLDDYQAALGATELRSLAGGYADGLVTTGMRLALRGGRPRSVLWWAERRRAVALRLPPTRAPDDPELAADLDRLRLIAARDGGGSGRELRAVEERIRHRVWRASGDRPDAAHPAHLAERLAERLGDRALVELAEVDGVLHAVALSAAGAALRCLGPAAPVLAESAALRFALRRLLLRGGTAATRRAAEASARHAASRLDGLVFAPLRDALAGADGLVLVPSGALHATPWPMTATCRGRPLVVAPSATGWLTAASAPRPAGHTVLAAGPGLEQAEPEVLRLRPTHPGATVLLGAAATAGAVRAALDGARLAHLAAHGVFRADNPMFSHVTLADGPFTVYDLERLTRAPSTVVLSCCDLGLSAVHPGEELMGLTAALLGLGTTTVLAAVLPARDAAAHELMAALHRGLAAGAHPAEALAAARSGLDGDPTAAAFGCYGS